MEGACRQNRNDGALCDAILLTYYFYELWCCFGGGKFDMQFLATAANKHRTWPICAWRLFKTFYFLSNCANINILFSSSNQHNKLIFTLMLFFVCECEFLLGRIFLDEFCVCKLTLITFSTLQLSFGILMRITHHREQKMKMCMTHTVAHYEPIKFHQCTHSLVSFVIFFPFAADQKFRYMTRIHQRIQHQEKHDK